MSLDDKKLLLLKNWPHYPATAKKSLQVMHLVWKAVVSSIEG